MSEEFGKAFWEERYHSHASVGCGPPNEQLVAEVGDLEPGLALEAGCGEGADAVWLASRGWQVTAVDIAATALRRAREHAEALDDAVTGRIDWVRADLSSWTPAEERFELVCSHYVHSATSPEALFRRLASWVAPGGTLLLVGHHPSDEHSSHAAAPEVHVTAEGIAAHLDADEWDVAVAETRSRSVSDPHGHVITIRDAVVRARRRP